MTPGKTEPLDKDDGRPSHRLTAALVGACLVSTGVLFGVLLAVAWFRFPAGPATHAAPTPQQPAVSEDYKSVIGKLDVIQERMTHAEKKLSQQREAILDTARSTEGYLQYLDNMDLPGWPARRPDMGVEAEHWLPKE